MHLTPADRTFPRGIGQDARCPRDTRAATPLRTAAAVADGFLNYRFLPLCAIGQYVPAEEKVVSGFEKSLRHVAKYYGFQPLDVSDYAYPANLLLAHWDAAKQVRRAGRRSQLEIAEKTDGTVCLHLTETIDTGSTLFYIPLIPLYHWGKAKNNRRTADLLLSVCAYLFQQAGVPHYRDPDSYLGGSYEMHEEWVEEQKGELEDDGYVHYRSDLNAAYHYGDLIGRRIAAKKQLELLPERITGFTPHNDYERECLELAERTLALWRQYPKANIYQHEFEPDPDDEDYDDDYYSYLHIHEYVSFIARTDGHLYETLMENINNDFNERSKILEPEKKTCFDAARLKQPDLLAYEAKAFAVISQLCDLLNELP